jgi:hypothetical protein
MGAAGSKPEAVKPVGELNEKSVMVERPQSAHQPSVAVDVALTPDNISQWTKDLDEVCPPSLLFQSVCLTAEPIEHHPSSLAIGPVSGRPGYCPCIPKGCPGR